LNPGRDGGSPWPLILPQLLVSAFRCSRPGSPGPARRRCALEALCRESCHSSCGYRIISRRIVLPELFAPHHGRRTPDDGRRECEILTICSRLSGRLLIRRSLENATSLEIPADNRHRLSLSSTPAQNVSPSPIVLAGRCRYGAGTQVACQPSSSAPEGGRSSAKTASLAGSRMAAGFPLVARAAANALPTTKTCF
jgi:hypothetical protein